MRLVRNIWMKISLRKKMWLYAGLVIFTMVVFTVFTNKMLDYVLKNFGLVLSDNSKCQDFQQAMEEEADAFSLYVRERSLENLNDYKLACARTERCIWTLPYDYQTIGAGRYAQTWNVRNGYAGYVESRDQVLRMDPEDGNYIPSLYRVYGMQADLQTYARRLLQMTMAAGDASYQSNATFLNSMPYLLVLISGIMIAISLLMTRLLLQTVLQPLGVLVAATRKIAVNDFSGEDMTAENQDEMGELIQAFNKMKHATKGYIDSLMKNYEMSELLHKEEIGRVEAEKRLQAARLELLKSQINPHFLFNTLHMIGCMAKLEEASTTEKMITSMGNLFRYNLKTSEQIVPLKQELKVVQDYMYIQNMRFGSRVRYESDIQVDEERTRIPAFTLQPMVENAIVHGIARKDEGGRICLRAWMQGKNLVLSVADTGMGMDETELQALLEALEERQTGKVGIGLGNIYQRIHSMYQDGDLKIYSRYEHGTVIQMRIPQTQQEGDTEV